MSWGENPRTKIQNPNRMLRQMYEHEALGNRLITVVHACVIHLTDIGL